MKRSLVGALLVAVSATAIATLAARIAAKRSRGVPTPGRRKPGRRQSTDTKLLSKGAAMLQNLAPLRQFDIHLLGFHPLRDDPDHQMVAHHYCSHLSEDMMQCVLFDGEGKDARITGVEYVISERIYQQLPDEEKAYWHPHNYEILSGTLVAPRVPAAAEKALLRKKVNSYGKTWHFWMADEPLPYGEPKLAWSFNHDGEMHPSLLEELYRRGIDPAKKRAERADFCAFAHAQRGVDLMRLAFPHGTAAPMGVEDAGDP